MVSKLWLLCSGKLLTPNNFLYLRVYYPIMSLEDACWFNPLIFLSVLIIFGCQFQFFFTWWLLGVSKLWLLCSEKLLTPNNFPYLRVCYPIMSLEDVCWSIPLIFLQFQLSLVVSFSFFLQGGYRGSENFGCSVQENY